MIGAIVRGDTLADIGAVGIRKIGSAEPMQVQDQVHLGSCTKADDGHPDRHAGRRRPALLVIHLPRCLSRRASRFHPDFQTSTLAELLTHRASLPHDASWWNLPGLTTTDKRRAAAGAASKPPLTKPGTVYAYSNAGYVIAGLMAEQVSGQSWEN